MMSLTTDLDGRKLVQFHGCWILVMGCPDLPLHPRHLSYPYPHCGQVAGQWSVQLTTLLVLDLTTILGFSSSTTLPSVQYGKWPAWPQQPSSTSSCIGSAPWGHRLHPSLVPYGFMGLHLPWVSSPWADWWGVVTGGGAQDSGLWLTAATRAGMSGRWDSDRLATPTNPHPRQPPPPPTPAPSPSGWPLHIPAVWLPGDCDHMWPHTI